MQHLDHLDIAALGFAVVGGFRQRSPALRRLGVDIGAGRDQQLHRRHMACVRGMHQRGFARLIDGGMIGTGIEQVFELSGIARSGGGK